MGYGIKDYTDSLLRRLKRERKGLVIGVVIMVGLSILTYEVMPSLQLWEPCLILGVLLVGILGGVWLAEDRIKLIREGLDYLERKEHENNGIPD